jgi:hypothetical protein
MMMLLRLAEVVLAPRLKRWTKLPVFPWLVLPRFEHSFEIFFLIGNLELDPDGIIVRVIRFLKFDFSA